MNDCLLCTKTCVDLNDTGVRYAISRLSLATGIINPTIKDLMIHFNAYCELDLWNKCEVYSIIGENVHSYIIQNYFKVVNIRDINDSLNASIIYDTLFQWEPISKKIFNKTVYFLYNVFSDFMETPNKFRDLDIDELLKYDALGLMYIILQHMNPSHAVSIYIDVKKKVILYFNASSHTPEPQLQYWFDKLISELKSRKGLTFTQINVVKNPIQIDDDDIQCAIWSLVFILSQLNGYHYKWISTLTFADIMEFKHMLINNFHPKTYVDLNDDKVRDAITKLSNDIGESNLTIKELMMSFNANCEIDLWKNVDVRDVLGDTLQNYILMKYFKVVNLNDISESVMNEDVDGVLYNWELNSRILFDKSFKFLIHTDLNFMETPNEIRDLDIDKLFMHEVIGFIYHIKHDGDEHGYTTVVYIDVNNMAILYFDFMGRDPPAPLQYWFDKLILKMKLRNGLEFIQINVVKTPIQIDDVQCNVWNLVFILSQLNGYNPEWISTLTVADIIGFKRMIFNHLQDFITY